MLWLVALEHSYMEATYCCNVNNMLCSVSMGVGGLIVTQRVLAVVQRLSHCHI
jgi:hypothetical protein